MRVSYHHHHHSHISFSFSFSYFFFFFYFFLFFFLRPLPLTSAYISKKKKKKKKEGESNLLYALAMAPPPAAAPQALKISDWLPRYRPSKSFQDTHPTAEITSLDFDDSGEFCIAASDDETLQLYDCRLGKHQKQLFSKKYGVHLAKFTHMPTTVIYASTKENGKGIFFFFFFLSLPNRFFFFI